jgi:GH24 family phage-related lysozyme (muramidase)
MKRLRELIETTEEDLELMSKTVDLPDGGKFDYVIIDDNMIPTEDGVNAFVTSVSAQKDANLNPIRGTKVIPRMLDWIKSNHPQIKFVMGNPIGDMSAQAFSKALNSDNIVKNKIFKEPLQEMNFKKAMATAALGAASFLPAKAETVDYEQLFKQIADHEGIKTKVYKDSVGHPTIGVGFNLDDKDNIRVLKKQGVDVGKLKSGQSKLSKKGIVNLYKYSLHKAEKDVRSLFPNYDSLPAQAKMVLLDMSFNLGKTRLSKFKNFRTAIQNMDFQTAADEMVDSKWYRQVKRRGVYLVNMMRNVK